MNPPDVRQWLIDNKWYEDYRKTLGEGERFSMNTVLPFIKADEEINKKFGKDFALSMDRDSLIKYIEENGLEGELDKKVEEKWESFESSLASGRKPKYFSQQPRSTDEDVII
jgi:hypothetical protein